MHWYEGSISSAISEAKQKKKIFLVYIEGDDDLSKQMNATYDDQSVTQKLESNGFIAVKLQANSEACKQFSQIYPVVIIPSSFFIGNNGIPLEVIAGSLNPEQFIFKVDNVTQLHNNQTSKSVNKEEVMKVDDDKTDSEKLNCSNSSATLNTETTTTCSLNTYQVSSAVQEDKSTDVEMSDCTSPVDSTLKNDNHEQQPMSSTSQDDSDNFEQKMKRAKRLIEERQVKREEEDRKKEKDQEIERRRVSKELQKAKKERQKNELKEWAEDRAKEKEEERLARERVRAQIAQDRAERAARYQQMTEQLHLKQQEAEANRKAEQERVAAEASRRSEFANIQFRLPNGSSVIHQFSASATLREAQTFVSENIRPDFSNFSMSTTFPRREFIKNDYSQTLRDLQLAPSATILILPIHSTTLQGPSNSVFSLLWSLLTPVTVIWTYITNFFFTSTTDRTSETTQQQQQQPSTSTQESENSTENNRKPRNARSNIYQEGNIYRLSNQQADDDDNNTWNGNSTQQM